jgi:hypothetical protein
VDFATHEVGHILGFRHEHAHGDWPDAEKTLGFCNEDRGSIAELTELDEKSVMMYTDCTVSQHFSGNPISWLDGVGARKVYGAPAAWSAAYGALY